MLDVRKKAPAALLAGLALAAAGTIAGAQAQEEPTIAFVSFTQDITDMYGQILRGMERRLGEAGLSYDLTTAAPAGADDFAGMDRILADIATLSPDFAVVGGASFELIEDRIAEIEATGTTAIVIDVIPDTLEHETPVVALTWVGVDHYQMGRVGGGYMAEQFCEEGRDPVRIALFHGTAASEISRLRISGAMDAFAEVTEACGISYEVVNEVYADFSRERSYNLMTTVATAHPDLDLVVGANSNTALGIMDALDAGGLLGGQLQILGMGGQLDEMAAICRGDIAAAGFRDAQRMGFDTADAILAAVEGRQADVPRVTITELPVLYDCETVFENVPFAMLDNPGFRDLIPSEIWEEYLARQ
ncbi:MAG: sugar ABC transporter substrate-binding protein [Alphaproteobacteria bacterium]